MTLNKKLFYQHLKSFTTNKLPIYISMPIDSDGRYRINLSEDRITSMKIKFNPNFTLQIIDTTKSGYYKYLCDDICFNLIDKHITSDYQLYKFINSLIEQYIKVE